MKRCSNCKADKPLEAFARRSRSRDGRQNECRECGKVRTAQRCSSGANAEQCRARRLADPQKYRAMDADYKARNPTKKREWTQANRQHVAAYQARYTTENLPRYRAHNAKRAAAKLQATPQWADKAAIAAIYAEAKRISDETGVKHHVDHEIPLRAKLACGLHVQGNLRIIPALDNLRKRNRLEESCLQPS